MPKVTSWKRFLRTSATASKTKHHVYFRSVNFAISRWGLHYELKVDSILDLGRTLLTGQPRFTAILQ